MKTVKSFVAASCAFVALTGWASAATVINASSGLSSPDTLVTFSEVTLLEGDPVTDEFSAQGVTFSPALYYTGAYGSEPNIDDIAVHNFGVFPRADPFIINFLSDVSAATFAMVTETGTAEFTALLNGSVVESFSADTGRTSASNFYGFTNILFDQIRVDVDVPGSAMVMDNVAYKVAAVPVPASFSLLFAGMGAFGLMRRRRKFA